MNRNDTILSGTLYVEMVKGGAGNLANNRSIVNDLNVFPIPDGDTGDNMFMTIDSGVSSAEGMEEPTLGDIAGKLAKGMLLGARGNSGVILSRIFAGIAKGFEGVEKADIPTLGQALERGVRESYNAVSEPTEGTILTVYREAVQYANGRISNATTLSRYFDDFTEEVQNSLLRTPELLNVLKEAGVVDSGGAGLFYIAQGMKDALSGKMPVSGGTPTDTRAPKKVDTSRFNEDSVLQFGYCTEFLLQLQNCKVDVAHFDPEELFRWLNDHGESVVAFAEGSVIKVHIHTMHPGEILNHCQQYGEFLTLKIENMTLQHSEVTIENRFEVPKPKKKKKFALVCVAAGEGMKNTLFSMGVDQIVDGGQSMNPSTGDFLDAFGKIDAETIFVFPNNGNVILTAHQAAELYKEADVRVVQSKNIGQGYAGVSMFDTSSDNADEIEKELADALENVVTGSVSRSIRDTEKDGIRIQTGDYIGFVDDRIYVAAPDALTAAKELARKLDASSKDILLLLCGAEAKEEEARKLYEELKADCRRAEVIFIDGGQPVFDYVLVLE